jgi:hypothetical protein
LRKLFFFPALFILTVFPLLSQELMTDNDETAEAEIIQLSEEGAPPSPPDQTPYTGNNQLYVISAFEFDIKGRSRPSALLYNGEFHEGEKLQGRENFEKYIRDKTQMLINQRVLKDNAVIDYSIGEQGEDGAYPVTLIIKVEDSWNMIALPRPAYKTDTGFDLTIKARDYNFLGTMNPLRIDLGYQYDENQRSSFLLGVFSSTPFRAFGYDWNFKFDNTLSYRPQVSEPYYYQNISGLSMELPFRTTTFTFGFEESTNLNEENADQYQAQYGEFQNGLYMASKLFTSWEIPTGFMVSQFGELTYNPGISVTFNHEFPKWPLQDIRKGPFMGFYHSLGFEKIDWHGNYREGLSVFFNNAYTYDFFRMNNNEEPLSVSYSLTGTGHFIINDFFAISSRLMYRQWFYHYPEYYTEASDAIRGVADRAISADYMLSLNMDFPLRIPLFTPSKWFHSRKLGFFDFELHVSPIIDMALYHDPETETSFSFKNIAATGGFEFIVFPLSFRSLYIRLGLAWNLREFFEARPVKFPEGDNREIYLIMGHFY